MADETNGTTGTPISDKARAQLDKVASKPPVFLQLGRIMGQALSPVLNNAPGVKSPIFKELGISEKAKDYVPPAETPAMAMAAETERRRRRTAILSGDLGDDESQPIYAPRIGGTA